MIFSFVRTIDQVLRGQSLPVLSLFFPLFGGLPLCTTFVMASDLAVKMYSEEFKKQFAEFSEREKRIIEERLGVGYERRKGQYHKSREEVCEMFALTDKRLREIEEKAIRLLNQ